MTVSKSQIVQVLKHFGDELTRRYQHDPDWLARFRSGDDEATTEILAPACRESGVTLEDVEIALASDPELDAYFQHVIGEAVLADINPGPDNPHARESSGAAGSVRLPRRWWQFWRSW